jgi:hypothetical protein
LAGIRVKLRKSGAANKIKCFDMNKLKDKSVKGQFEITVGGQFNALLEKDQNIEDTWSNMKTILCDTAETLLGYKQMEKKSPWLSKHVLELSDKRKELKSQKVGVDAAARADYNKITKEIRKEERQCKEAWLCEQCAEVEEASRWHDTGRMCKKIKTICGEFSAKITSVKDNQGELLQEKQDIKNRWKEYFTQLYSMQNSADEKVLNEITSTNMEEVMDEFQEQEIRSAIQSLKACKASGVDNITAKC